MATIRWAASGSPPDQEHPDVAGIRPPVPSEPEAQTLDEASEQNKDRSQRHLGQEEVAHWPPPESRGGEATHDARDHGRQYRAR